MEFKKINTPTLKELFVQELEHSILSGKLAVGERIPSARELAASMQISRSVVNAGLSELEAKGFIVVRPRVGTFVADYRKDGSLETLICIMNYNGGILRKEEVKSILEIRKALDILAIELAVPRITEEGLEILEKCVQKMKNVKNTEEASELAFEFQHDLAFYSGNTLIPLIFSSFRAPVITLWKRFCDLYGVESIYTNTRGLLNYIKERDAKKAVEWMNEYLHETIDGKKQIYY